MSAINYVIGILGVMGTMAASFIAGWLLGPRVITPLVQRVLAKVNDAVQSK